MSQPEQAPEHLHRNVWVAGFVSLLTDVSSEMIVPVLPLFLRSVLHASTGAIGLIEGTAEFTASIVKSVSGWLSDRMGRRKPLMVAGYGGSNLIKPLLGLAGGWGTVLGIRMADRFGKGVRGAPRDALIADSTHSSQRGRAFGLHRALDTTGAGIGPLAAALVLWLYHGNMRAVFWWTALPGLLSVLLLVFFLKDTGKGRAPGQKGPLLRGWTPSLAGMQPRLRLLIAISTLFALGNSADAFLILRASDLGVPAALVPVAYFCFNLTYALSSYPAGALSDRIGRRPVLVAGFAVFALIYAGFGAASHPWHVWALFLAYGLYYAFTEGIQKAYVTDLANPGERGTALGAFNAYTGIAALPASAVAGWLYSAYGAWATFYVSAAVAVLAAAMLLLFIPSAPANA